MCAMGLHLIRSVGLVNGAWSMVWTSVKTRNQILEPSEDTATDVRKGATHDVER